MITTDSALLHLLAEPEGDGDGSHHGVSCHGVFLWGEFISIQDSSSHLPLEPTIVAPLDGDGGGGEAGQLPQRGGDPQRLQILLKIVAALELPRPQKRLHLDYFPA